MANSMAGVTQRVKEGRGKSWGVGNGDQVGVGRYRWEIRGRWQAEGMGPIEEWQRKWECPVGAKWNR